MAIFNGRITKIGSTSGAQPQGRFWLLQNEGLGNELEVSINVDTSPGSARWDLVLNAFLMSRPVAVDVLNTQGTVPNPYVADQVRITS